jgi:hypothetical protein
MISPAWGRLTRVLCVQLQGEALGNPVLLFHGIGIGCRAGHTGHDVEHHAQAGAVDGAGSHQPQGYGGYQQQQDQQADQDFAHELFLISWCTGRRL